MAGTDNTIDLLNLQFTGNENEQQYIIFMVGKEEFGLEVLKVQEIIRYLVPTKIPHAPMYVEGVIDFRGEVIPVLSMRKRFGLPDKEDIEFQVIIVTEVNTKIIGLTVDRVLDIANIPEDKIQLTTDFTTQEKTKYLKAVGKLGNRLILLLDLDKIMNFNDEKLLEEIISSVEKTVDS
ncbi:MAG TPA: chemotaxis protein CheW [Firmicutes bacterium]|jgi:purine-binding chemotaxis protein CheW|nr:chemotaxis protein CheW [Bacillota bacterium]HBT15967.1 chemotaxis protein CheW [Bacillota bacterium]